jgi:hypothetical protein
MEANSSAASVVFDVVRNVDMRSRDEDIVRVADVGVRRERCLKSALSRGGKLMQFFFFGESE